MGLCPSLFMPSSLKNYISIGMLVVEITFFEDDTAEMFGFWYHKERTLPETRDEKRNVMVDWATHRCCRLKLLGSAKQIEDILLTLDWNPSKYDAYFLSMEEMIMQAKKHRAVPFAFDNVVSPKGIAVSMHLSVRLKEDMDSVVRKLHSGNGLVSLQIACDWDLGSEIRKYTLGTAN